MFGCRGIIEPCHHETCTATTAFVYCSLLAVAFVGCLYVFVPPTIRKFSRDHPTHVRYRSQACIIVCAIATLSYPSFFCANDNGTSNNQNFSVGRSVLLPPHGSGALRETFGILIHTCILYTGSSLASLLYVYEFRKRLANPPSLLEQMQGFFNGLIPDNEQQFWICIRNFIIAPWTEEIVFRGCMIPVMLATGMSATRVALVAPLFFGVAHLHHAIQKISSGERPKMVIIITAFQFLYTSIFGSYASYAFVRVGSVLPVTLSHSYCNWRGLPDFGVFVNSRHPLHRYRGILFVSYIVGIGAFWYLFRVDALLPLPAKLPLMIAST